MQTALFVAGVVSVLTGVAHSVFGERLIFRRLRQGTLLPTLGAPPLHPRHVHILWATWHLASVFGWALAGVLFRMAWHPGAPPRELVLQGVAVSHVAASLLVLVGTRGRHPGWIALAAVALLAAWGLRDIT